MTRALAVADAAAPTTLETWADEGRQIVGQMKASGFALGDWYNRGATYGWGDQAEAATGVPLGTLKQAGVVAAAFPEALRDRNISFGHYQSLVSTQRANSERAAQLLERASNGATIEEIRTLVRSDRAPVEAEPAERAFPLADDGVSLLGEFGDWVNAHFDSLNEFEKRRLIEAVRELLGNMEA